MSVTMRDARHLNHMDPDTKRIHARLEQWASWAKSGLSDVSWPSQTILSRMMEQGANGAAQAGKPPISMPEEVAIVDAAVAKLGVIDRRVIQCYYFQWAPMEKIWEGCEGVHSLSNFKAVLKRARWRLAGMVDGFEHHFKVV